MAKTHRSHEDATIEMFQKDPTLAADYLNDVLAAGDEVDLMMALRYLSDAFGGVQEIARKADANRQFNETSGFNLPPKKLFTMKYKKHAHYDKQGAK